ncbi:aldehyde dehydrogenase family protein, partial [Kocuria sp. CPCC 205268]|uniref:aldehyde dehydrogenase family protein n=1 Tax=Kocuria oxytropis TaxID=3058913 RepID=UPI0034D3DA9D
MTATSALRARAGIDRPAYRSIDPATGQLVTEVPTATGTEVQEALDAADAAFRAWRSRPIEERAAVAARVGALFAERADELAVIATQEMGKPL